MKLWALRPPVLRWWWLVLAVWALQAAWLLLRWAAGHLWAPAAVAVLAAGWWMIDTGAWWLPVAVCALAVLAAYGWAEQHQVHGWAQLRDAIASTRRLRWYRQRWAEAMDGCGLIRAGVVPVLESHRYGGAGERDLEVLTVAMAPGQLPGDWRQVASRIAGALHATGCRAHPVYGRTGAVQLFLRHRPLRDRVNGAQQAGDPGMETGMPSDVPQPGPFPRTPRSAA